MEEQIKRAFASLAANVLEKSCQKENMLFGSVKPDQTINFDTLCFEVFRDRIDYLFTDVPIDKSYDGDGEDIYHYKFGLYDYVKSIYPLFKEIIETEVTPDLFAAVPDVLDKDVSRDYYIKAIKFVLAIKLKGLRQGGRVDRYIAKMPFISPFLMRLIKKQKGHYYLKNNDLNRINYKFALLSCFQFMNDYKLGNNYTKKEIDIVITKNRHGRNGEAVSTITGTERKQKDGLGEFVAQRSVGDIQRQMQQLDRQAEYAHSGLDYEREAIRERERAERERIERERIERSERDKELASRNAQSEQQSSNGNKLCDKKSGNYFGK